MSYSELCRATPEYMSLPKMKFKLSLKDYRDDDDLKNVFLEIIKRKNMANYYADVCKELRWEIDETLHENMAMANVLGWHELDEAVIDPNLENSAKKNWQGKFEYACEIGDFDRGVEIAAAILDDATNSSSSRAEAAFGLFRVAYLRSNVSLMGKMISQITSVMEVACTTGSDWCCRNKLKVYEAIYCLATRNFGHAASLLIDCIPTFESCELLPFKELVEYTVLAGLISLERAEVNRQFNNNGVLQQALLMESPKYKDYFSSLYDCHYKDFFGNLAWIETEMKTNPLLHSHYRYYVREMRLKAYSQLLQAYRTLGLTRMAMEFGVTEEYIEQEVARFIANGKLHCKIDKVAGAIVTVSAAGCDKRLAPDATCDRGLTYQNTIKRSDALLNRLKKLGQVINF